MSKILKRTLSAVAALAVTATCLTAATMPTFTASADDVTGNVAPYGVPYDESDSPIYGNGSDANYSLDFLNDGNLTSQWQWQNKPDGNDSVGMKFTVPVQATSFRILGTGFTNDSNANNDAIINDGGYILEYNDGTQWVDVTSNAVEGTDNWLTVTFDSEVNLTAARITFLKATKWAPRLLEFEVYGTILSIDVAKIDLIDAIAEAEALAEVDYTEDSWAGLQTALTDAETALSGTDEAAVSQAIRDLSYAKAALVRNTATQLADAVAAAGEIVRYRYDAASLAALDAELAKVDTTTDPDEMGTLAEAINNAIDNLVIENLALNKASLVDSEDQVWGNPQLGLNDGSMDTRWQSNVGVNPAEGMVNWAAIDFGTATTFDNIDLYYETSRPSQAGTTVQYSQDGVVWNEIENFTFTGDINVALEGTNNKFYQGIHFDAVMARYVRVYYTQAHQYDHMSIWEFEVYNSLNSQLAAPTTVADFEIKGAQTRVNAEDAAKNDLRFIVTFSANLYAELEAGNITNLGVIIEKMADGTTKTVSATYLRNIELVKNGKYTYTVTVLGIADADSMWGCTAFYTTAEGDVLTTQLVRSVNG